MTLLGFIGHYGHYIVLSDFLQVGLGRLINNQAILYYINELVLLSAPLIHQQNYIFIIPLAQSYII